MCQQVLPFSKDQGHIVRFTCLSFALMSTRHEQTCLLQCDVTEVSRVVPCALRVVLYLSACGAGSNL